MADIEEQPLPRTFEEFNEQRKAAFIRVKDYKQAGNRLVGFFVQLYAARDYRCRGGCERGAVRYVR